MTVSYRNEMVTARVQDLVLADSVAVEALVEMLEERSMVTRDDVRDRVRSIRRGRNRIRRGARVFEDLAGT